MKLFRSHTTPSIHPTVVSPRKVRQLSTMSSEKCRPATSAVKRIKPVATAYQIACRMRIWVRIFKGGSSVRAPGRGGRRRRGIVRIYSKTGYCIYILKSRCILLMGFSCLKMLWKERGLRGPEILRGAGICHGFLPGGERGNGAFVMSNGSLTFPLFKHNRIGFFS